jgi:hypothetical protein
MADCSASPFAELTAPRLRIGVAWTQSGFRQRRHRQFLELKPRAGGRKIALSLLAALVVVVIAATAL